MSRLLYILNRLDKGEINLQKMAKDMGVSVRSVQRYINTIDEADFPIYNPRPGIWTFVEGFNLSKMQIWNS